MENENEIILEKGKAVSYSNGSDDEKEEGDLSGISLEKMSLGPKRKLLILSLGGLLCHRVRRGERHSIIRCPDASHKGIKVFARPYCKDFMKFCFERFDVGIWSSAKEHYLDHILDSLMGPSLRPKLLFALDQSQCTHSGFKTLENKHMPLFLKELKKIWDGDYDPSFRGKYSSSNTLLIDQQPYKGLVNPPYTAIFPTQYTAEDDDDKALGPEGEIRFYLEGLADADDVPSYVKEHPFGQPAITAEHPDWDFYHQVIQRQG